MADNDNSQDGQGDKADRSGDNGKSQPGEGDKTTYVTPQVLKGSQDALKRWQKEYIDEAVGGAKADILAAIEKSQNSSKGGDNDGVPASGKPKEKGKQADNPELVELRRKVDQLTQSNSTLSAKLDDAAEREKKQARADTIREALQRHKCKKVDAALRVIDPDLKQDEEDPRRVFATVDGEHGTEELSADEYVSRVFKVDVCPEFFEGSDPSKKGGSPAGGDASGGGGDYSYTVKQISDPEFYIKNRDKIREAIDKGRVKGLPAAVGS